MSGHPGGKTSARGYGRAHQAKRAEVARLVNAGIAKCSRCGGTISPQQKWHLDHEDHPLAHQLNLWRGPSHERCNIAARRGPVERQPPAAALAFFNPIRPVEQQAQNTGHHPPVTQDQPPQHDWPF